MRKIAVPTVGNRVDDHFGHCEMYSVFTVDDKNSITNREILPSPQGCGCKSNIAAVLQQLGVKVMLAGGIGEGAINILKNHDISVVRGCSGEVNSVTEQYLNGTLTDSGTTCLQQEYHHPEGHSCKH